MPIPWRELLVFTTRIASLRLWLNGCSCIATVACINRCRSYHLRIPRITAMSITERIRSPRSEFQKSCPTDDLLDILQIIRLTKISLVAKTRNLPRINPLFGWDESKTPLPCNCSRYLPIFTSLRI